MKKWITTTALTLSILFLQSTALSETAQTPAPNPDSETATIQVKMFTRDQLANALQTIVDKINGCKGDTECLKKVKEWNESAMTQVKSNASNFANSPLSLEVNCNGKTKTETINTNENGQFTLNGVASTCQLKGTKPKCGALEKGKKYPFAKTGETLYCITGDDTKLKQTTTDLKTAIISAMKESIKKKTEQNKATESTTEKQAE